MSAGVITLLMFAVLLVFLVLGLPLGFVMGGVGVGFALLLWGTKSLLIFSSIFYTSGTYFILVALPGFYFMAMVLQHSGLADDLYKAMHCWVGGLRGGLAMGTVLICTAFAAMSGISGTATITMGLIALPAMLNRNYDKRIAVGCISAGGALGVLIPPSSLMIIWGAMADVSVGQLFMGGVFPGLLLSALFIIYIGVRAYLQPELGPSIPREERADWREKLGSLRAVVLPVILIITVLGVIFTGLATPTEASAVGALGSLLCAAIYRRLKWPMFKEACYGTLRLTAMVMWIILGAKCFIAVYTALGAPQFLQQILSGLAVNRWIILLAIQVVLIMLGMFLDPAGIATLCAPIFLPIVVSLGFDPVWFGILFVMNMEIGYLTPPFGFNLFYMRGVAPPSITMGDIYRSITPFVVLQAIGLLVVMAFPQIALWLPTMMIR